MSNLFVSYSYHFPEGYIYDDLILSDYPIPFTENDLDNLRKEISKNNANISSWLYVKIHSFKELSSGSKSPRAGEKCILDKEPATILCTCGIWAWVVKDSEPNNPETVAISLLE